jgi:stage II sporulation protein P
MKILEPWLGGGWQVNYYFRYLIYRHRYRLSRVYATAALAGSFFLVAAVLYFLVPSGYLTRVLDGKNFSLFGIATSWSERDPSGLLRSAAPVMAWGGNSEDYPEEITPASLVTAILGPFRINLGDPDEVIALGVPALAEYGKGEAVPVTAAAGALPEDAGPKTPVPLTRDVLVGIYHTHTGETYTLTDGVARVDGQKGGVVEAGRAVKETLEAQYGIRTVHNDRVNDANYGLAYAESEKTARRLLEDNSEVEILLDIHRDAGKSRNDSVVTINGEEMAPLLFICGSDARSPFPSWRNNHSFALKLSERINKEYPGLSLGVRVKEGRYNQFLHPRALLVEVGSENNSTQEAVRSARLLARVLAEELKELAPGKMGGAQVKASPGGQGMARADKSAD